MRAGDWIALALIAGAAVLVVVLLIRKRHSGCTGCCANCQRACRSRSSSPADEDGK